MSLVNNELSKRAIEALLHGYAHHDQSNTTTADRAIALATSLVQSNHGGLPKSMVLLVALDMLAIELYNTRKELQELKDYYRPKD